MNEYEAFGKMELEGWSDQSRVSTYAALFAAASDQAVPALLAAVNAAQGHSALDICCGQGNVSEALQSRGCVVTGLDFSPAMLALARSRVPGASFRQGDAAALPFADESFDLVVSNFGICHVPDQPRALAEAHRVLRPGGRFAMTVWCGPEASPCFKLLYETIRAHGSPTVTLPASPDFHQFSKPEIAQELFAQAGFSGVELTVVDCAWHLDNPALLCDIFEKGTVRGGMMLYSQPPERLAAIRDAMALRVREQFSDNGAWRVPIPAALVSAKKV
jgi:ubiquinone/menaquinone biosynthesis C-methylase UbiE